MTQFHRTFCTLTALITISLCCSATIAVAEGSSPEKKTKAVETENKKIDNKKTENTEKRVAKKVKLKPYIHHQNVTYIKREKRELKAEVFVPNRKGKFPGVLVVHGGAWRAGSRYQLVGLAKKLANAGFTSVAIEYRLAPAAKFPAQIHDCKAAVRWMKTNAVKYQIDAKRIGGCGYSAGGHLVALLAVTKKEDGLEGPEATDKCPSTELQAVVAGGAPCDFQFIPSNNTTLSYWLGGTRKEKPEVYKKASPLYYVDKNDPPIMFVHGEKDRIVYRQLMTLPMYNKLQKLKVPTSMYLVKNSGHFKTMFDKKAADETVSYLKEKLQTQ